MSLNKAILHNKEHRKPYGRETGTYAQSVDASCRNHGSCSWCMGNRLHKIRKKEVTAEEEMRSARNCL